MSAADRAGEILGRVADGFRTMKRYTVRFEIVADDYRTAGGYAVSDGNYRLYLGDDAEVFSDGKVRYEVDHRRGEVTISEVNRSSRNILDNPVRAFDFLDSAGSHRIASAPELDGVEHEGISQHGHFIDRDNPQADKDKFVQKLAACGLFVPRAHFVEQGV